MIVGIPREVKDKEFRVGDLARAQELKRRGYIVTPDPTLPESIEGFRKGEIKEFEHHSRVGFVDHEGLLKEMARLRKVGFRRITLKTGAYSMLALGAPNFKAVCMGRALMIPGMVGKNIGDWIKAGQLPKTVSKFGTKVDEIFVSYEELRLKYGKDVEKLPLGAIGIYTASQKIRTGKDRTINLSTITRRDLMSLTEECEKVTGIPYVMRAYRKEAEKILAQ